MRKFIRLAISAVVGGFLVWVLPAAAQAGIVPRRRLTREDARAAALSVRG